MYQQSTQLIASTILLSLCACTTTAGKVVVAPQPKLVIPTPLLEPMKIDTNFQTNLQTFSKWKPTEQIK
jgi:hypothetical protein